MKNLKKIFSLLLNILCIFLILFNIYVVYLKLVEKKDTIDLFGYSLLVVVSGSMEPEIAVDDMVIIKKSNEYKVNDIITYKSTKSLITHRIVKTEDNLIYTQGDSNNTIDEPIQLEQIKGKVVHKIRGAGKVLDLITSPALIAVYIGISALLIFRKKN